MLHEHSGHIGPGSKRFPHETVNQRGEYVRQPSGDPTGEVVGAIHTNTIENFRSLLKRCRSAHAHVE